MMGLLTEGAGESIIPASQRHWQEGAPQLHSQDGQKEMEYSLNQWPDFNLNGGFLFSGSEAAQAVKVSSGYLKKKKHCEMKHFGGNASHSVNFITSVKSWLFYFKSTGAEWMANVSWLYADTDTKTRGRSKTHTGSVQSPCLNKSKMQSRLLNHLLWRGLSWNHFQAQQKPHWACGLN